MTQESGRIGERVASNESVQEQFSSRAHRYKTSHVHASGEDLTWIVSEASLQGHERVLDVGTGAGHTAFALAEGAWTVTGIDLTAKMVENATQLAADRGLRNVQFVVGDAVHMPFPDQVFDVVTCRFAAHHFVDADASIREMSRVLKPGGMVLMVDHIAPADVALDAYVNRIDWLRDPSHVREWTAEEWHERFRTAGIATQVAREWDLHMEVSWWLEQAATDEQRRLEIDRMFREADEQTRRTFSIAFGERGEPRSFALKCALFKGRRA
ncbi:methyltransferase domain-containing protein [Alicyclobacillus fastidiosus]|uniref:Methyltransferase domain-containing protein n=1 Tax=Alicyclobacillus fastidiosus TaxID=392011 RepID=A0ABY6ZJA1_9BACL|nr:methyltransferase domain-containing protein [Alicyclobacillus fastidiosus]WAH42562.1 methyltransferase domain-containing protein [Alicyclobacillus fastidiosus]GMA64415.1 putative methyltransferase YcgJ [Alicyclobacillus fastidiosus]